MNCWRCGFAHVVTLLLVAGPASVSATQEGARETAIEPCRESCGLTLVPEREYGDDSGPGMIEAAGARAWLDESGRLYLLGAVTHVQVYGPDGAFLQRISRRGSGPGELENGHSLVVTGDGVFSILDRSQGKILTFDWNGELLHEIRPHGWFPFGSGTVHVGGPLAVHHADIQTPDRVGYPLHLVNLETGEAVGSFGSLTGEYDLFSGLNHVIARGPDRSVWMAEKYAYKIEQWEPNRILRSLRRKASWFPEVPVPERSHGWGERPDPAIVGIAADDSLLWVFIATADEQWEKMGENRDFDLFYDTMIEVIDWKRKSVIASERFDESFYHWIGPGLFGRLVVTTGGSVRYQTTRVQLDGR